MWWVGLLLWAGGVEEALASSSPGGPLCPDEVVLAAALAGRSGEGMEGAKTFVSGFATFDQEFVGEVIAVEWVENEEALDEARLGLADRSNLRPSGWESETRTRYPEVFPGSVAWVLRAWTWRGKEGGRGVPDAVWLREPRGPWSRFPTTMPGWHGVVRIPREPQLAAHHECTRRLGTLLLHPTFTDLLDEAFGHEAVQTEVLDRILTGGREGSLPTRIELENDLGSDGGNGLLISMLTVLFAAWRTVAMVWAMTRSEASQRVRRRPAGREV